MLAPCCAPPVGRALIRLAASAGEADEDQIEIRQQLFLDRYQSVRAVVTRAIERDEAPGWTGSLAAGRALIAALDPAS